MQPIIIKTERTDKDIDNSSIEIQTPTNRIDECGNEYIYWTKEVILTTDLENRKQKEVNNIQASNEEITKFEELIAEAISIKK